MRALEAQARPRETGQAEGIDLAAVAPFQIGAVRVRPASREVSGPCGQVLAEPRALQVLVALAEAQGAVMSRAALVERCWSGRAIGEDAIQRAIAKARRLAELSDPAAFAIESIPRVGYRLATAAPPPASASPAAEPLAPSAPTAARRRPGRAMAAALVVAALLVAALGTWLGRSRPPASGGGASPVEAPARRRDLPADPTAAALLLQARDDWAQRDADSLDRSIAELQRVTRLAPGFAPAFADLADAYLLAGEAGSLPEAVAFDGADHAAARARQLDPTLAAAPRAQGFVAYWWRHDRAASRSAFEQALRLDPNDAQTHFWYANVLADEGDFDGADRAFARARLGDPGSEQIGADYAWSLWVRGRDAEALARLRTLLAAHPRSAEAQDCLATILLAMGDDPGALRAMAARARLRREPALQASASALADAYARSGPRALLALAFAQEMERQADAPYPDHSEAAFYASLAGDRAALLKALHAADAEHEAWGSAGYVRRVRARWRADPQVAAALDRRQLPKPG